MQIDNDEIVVKEVGTFSSQHNVVNILVQLD